MARTPRLRSGRACVAPIPDGLLLEAYRTGSGEALWPVTAARRVVAWAAASGYAVEGGEVYEATGPMATSFVEDWEFPLEDELGDSWVQYVARAADRARERIAAAEASGGARRRYFLALVGPLDQSAAERSGSNE